MTAVLVRSPYLLLLCLLVPIRAQAQPLVVPWSVGDDDVEALASRVSAAIDAHGAMPIESVRTALEARSSSPPPLVPPETLDRWTSLARDAVRSLARGDHAAASSALAEVEVISAAFLLALNRDDARARHVLDACLFDVRARLETHAQSAASRALACRQRSPRVTPSPYAHPPEVLVLLDAPTLRAPLHVESVPSGCEVRLNGVALGPTPLDTDALSPGDYVLQVECDAAPGRVHAIALEAAGASVTIDAGLEAVVRSEPMLRLSYASRDESEARRVDDALALGAMLGASETWLLSGDGSLVRADAPAAAPSIPASASYDRSAWEIGTGIGLGVLGVGALVTSGVLVSVGASYGQLATQPFPTDPDYLARRAQWSSWQMPALATGWIGGALLTTALPLLLPRSPGVPEWSWWIGGAGLALVGTGLALALAEPTCGNERPTSSCIQNDAIVEVGSMIASVGVPMLAVPITYWIAERIGAPITPTVSASPTGGSIGVESEW